MASSSPTPSLTPSVGSSPPPNTPVQPDHFYDGQPILATPDSDGKTWLDPDDDRLAARGIPVFKPTMDEFRDFEAYMKRVEPWGMNSGIIKVIPPQEWKNSLPPLREQLSSVEIRTPIEQHMLGQAGLFRQQNFEKRKTMSVREWAELCGQDEYRAPGVGEVGLHARANVKAKARTKTRKATTAKAETVEPSIDEDGQVHIKEEPVDAAGAGDAPYGEEQKPKTKGRRQPQTKQTKEARLAERTEKDKTFLETFDPHTHWLPPETKPEDYTPEFCAKLERHYWRNCGLGRPPWYGADTQGSLYTDDTEEWNVAHLESELSRLLPFSDGLPGVNTPYLYWGMWRATFAWHVEDMDLFSINYIHFGAPKFWYAVPQGRASSLEHAMRSFFPKDTSQCQQFLRHKSFLASPTLLAKSSCKPNHCVQHAGEFIITFPKGYHAGFNLGFNCAESVNFALASWLELGKVARACECISDSVRIDVNKLLEERERRERAEGSRSSSVSKSQGPGTSSGKSKRPSPDAKPSSTPSKKKPTKTEELLVLIPPLPKAGKRKSDVFSEEAPKRKKPKKSSEQTQDLPTLLNPKPSPIKITLKLGPRPAEPDTFPCCLCISMSKVGLLRVQDPPLNRKDALDACGYPRNWVWMAHKECASIVPETWVDETENPETGQKEEAVFGVDGIVKDRWNLKCTACTKTRPKAHGAPIQCTKGKCPKAFHISCARDITDNNVVFDILKEVEKEVVLVDSNSSKAAANDVSALQPETESDRMQVDLEPALPPSTDDPDGTDMAVDQPNRTDGEHAEVLKVVKKYEVQVLCTQHNPAVAARKKASKQERIKQDLSALPPMARIKIRVSAGVFEVSLIRVIEETSSVEVLWDRSKREFKWGSVVFGNTEGPVQSKPSEAAPPESFRESWFFGSEEGRPLY
ncbi:JmjC-domain-containing protein [Marasmius fiardii PR-910]|nr:JmjC-domain-containing protein [Marasmius fiardii PR-910]